MRTDEMLKVEELRAEVERLTAMLHRASLILAAVAAGSSCQIAAGDFLDEIRIAKRAASEDKP